MFNRRVMPSGSLGRGTIRRNKNREFSHIHVMRNAGNATVRRESSGDEFLGAKMLKQSF
jgi:hypothetical protein